MSSSIREATLACDNVLKRYWATHQSDPWLQRSIIDFKVWSYESGALMPGRRGLDEQLCTRKLYRSCLLQMLNTIHDDLQNALGSTTQTTLEPNHSVNLESQQDRIKRTVKTMVREIVDLTNALIKSLPCTMLWEAEETPLTEELDFELGRFKLYMHNLVRKTIATHHWVQESPRTEIWNRIIEGNVRRRKRFLNTRAKKSTGNTQNSRPPWTRRSKVRIPDPPKRIPDSQTVQCPFCYEMLPSCFTEPIAWRKHILSDLEPYCCLIPNCSDPDRLYSSEASWRSHMESHLSQEPVSDHMALDEPFKKGQDTEEQHDIECPLCEGPSRGTDRLQHISWCLLDFAMKSMLHESEDEFEMDIRATQGNAQNQYRPYKDFVYTLQPPANIKTESISNVSNDISTVVIPAFSDVADDGLLAPSPQAPFRERSSSQPQIYSPIILKTGQLSPLSTATERSSTGSGMSSLVSSVYHARSYGNLRVQSHLYGGPLQNTFHFPGHEQRNGESVVKREIESIYSELYEARKRHNTEVASFYNDGLDSSDSVAFWHNLSVANSNNVGLEPIGSPS